jgi:hypothetical protein
MLQPQRRELETIEPSFSFPQGRHLRRKLGLNHGVLTETAVSGEMFAGFVEMVCIRLTGLAQGGFRMEPTDVRHAFLRTC